MLEGDQMTHYVLQPLGSYRSSSACICAREGRSIDDDADRKCGRCTAALRAPDKSVLDSGVL